MCVQGEYCSGRHEIVPLRSLPVNDSIDIQRATKWEELATMQGSGGVSQSLDFDGTIFVLATVVDYKSG